MKTPYTIESWKAGKKAVTRDPSISVLQNIERSDRLPGSAFIGFVNGRFMDWTSEGKFFPSGSESPHDLFEKED